MQRRMSRPSAHGLPPPVRRAPVHRRRHSKGSGLSEGAQTGVYNLGSNPPEDNATMGLCREDSGGCTMAVTMPQPHIAANERLNERPNDSHPARRSWRDACLAESLRSPACNAILSVPLRKSATRFVREANYLIVAYDLTRPTQIRRSAWLGVLRPGSPSRDPERGSIGASGASNRKESFK
jgi:hypothetical protein